MTDRNPRWYSEDFCNLRGLISDSVLSESYKKELLEKINKLEEHGYLAWGDKKH